MKNRKELHFSGVYTEAFEGYVKYKTALGFDVEYRETLALVTLNEFLNKYDPPAAIITERMAMDYVHRNPLLSSATVHAYECRIRQLGLYMKNMGYKDIFVYPEKHTPVSSDFVPYIFTADEITRIFTAADQLENPANNPHYRLFPQTVIRLLYCTGLRISEALSLKIDDIDFKNDLITVYNSKGNVSRLVPFNGYIHDWLLKYHREASSAADMYFFESPRKGSRNRCAVGNTFQKSILPAAGIPRKPDNTGPRLHDLRHTFACHCLDKMIHDGADPFCALPYLSVYMGHKGIESTEKYLRLTEDHFMEITDACHYIYKKGLGDDYE